jgi:hypothetical protein
LDKASAKPQHGAHRPVPAELNLVAAMAKANPGFLMSVALPFGLDRSITLCKV